MGKSKKNFKGIYYTYAVYGFLTIILNSIINYMKDDYGLTYSTTGLIISISSAGSLIASFIAAYFVHKIGKKKSAIILSSLMGIGYVLFILSPFLSSFTTAEFSQGKPVNATTFLISLLFLGGLLLGIGRGSVNFINNAIINDEAEGDAKYIGYLHMFFAIGAFVTPIITAYMINRGYRWQSVILIGLALNVSMLIVYFLTPVNENIQREKVNSGKNNIISVYKNPLYYLAMAVFFFYGGAENAVNGWLVTYLIDENIVTDALAQTLFSVLWIVMMISRLLGAFMSTKLKKSTIVAGNSIFAMLIFFLFIVTKNTTVVVIAIIGMGMFFGPIYPTNMAIVGEIVKGDTKALSIMLSIAGLGQAILPMIIGLVADNIGISGGMITILLTLILLFISAILVVLQEKKRGIT